MKLVITGLLLVGCSTGLLKQEKSKKEIEKRQIETLRKVRPLLISDEFEFMKCEKLENSQVKLDSLNSKEVEFWKRFGLLELREKALSISGNILALKHSSFGGIQQFHAVIYSCGNVKDSSEVGDVGMCKPSEERMFKISYANEKARNVGEELLRQKVRYHAISKYYKTFSLRDIKYSYTKKEFSGKAAFYKCL